MKYFRVFVVYCIPQYVLGFLLLEPALAKTKDQIQSCRLSLILETKAAIEASVEKQLRKQNLSLDKNDEIIYRTMEKTLWGRDQALGKVINSYCRQ